MATEQDWEAYADQATLADTDTLLARTAAGAGVEVPGSALVRYKTNGWVPTFPQEGAGPVAGNGVANLSSSSSVFGAVVLDALNENKVVIASVAVDINLDGSSERWWLLTPAGVRTVDRRVGRLRLAMGHLSPGADNVQTIGSPGARWSSVHAVTGAIQTSDEREKVWRGGLTPAELAAARGIAGELGFFRWVDAVAEKGDDARLHFGVRAQRAWEIMAEHGLVDPIGDDGEPGTTPYAFLCWDEWEEAPAAPAILDEDGEVVMPATPAQPAGHRFGLRTDQLALFLIAAQEQRLAALEQSAG